MITKFKIYDSLKSRLETKKPPKVDDYVIASGKDFTGDFYDITRHYIDNTIGKILKITEHEPKYLVEYPNLPPAFYGEVTDNENQIAFFTTEIIYWSDDKEKLEMILAANKYNL